MPFCVDSKAVRDRFFGNGPQNRPYAEFEKHGEVVLRTLCYMIAATAMIAVAAGMGKAASPADTQGQTPTATEIAIR